MGDKANQDHPGFLKVVGKVFKVLEAMALAKDGVRISELGRALCLPKATVYRIVFTLQELGYVEKDASDVYGLTARIKGFTHDAGREILSRVALPHMERLRVQFEQTVNLAVLDDYRVYYLEILGGLRSIRMLATPHTYEVLYAPALGKAMLMFLDPKQIQEHFGKAKFTKLTPKTVSSLPDLMKQLAHFRKQGYSVDDEEVETGARGVAAPIFDSKGKPWAAISVSGPVYHIRMRDIGKFGLAVAEACQKVSIQMGFNRVPK